MPVSVPSPHGRAFGYADEVSAVREALVDPDRCGCLIIGPAGIGRTTVMNRALEHLTADATVYRLRGSELLRDRDLGVLEILLSQAGVHRHIGPGAALSVAARVFGSAAALPIVQIDNCNLVDVQSLSVLSQLADAGRIRLVAGAESIRPPVDLIAKLWLGGTMTRVDLGGLDEGTVAALIEDSGKTTRSAAELLRETGGNPRLLNQVVYGLDQARAHERILWNIDEELRPILEIIAMARTVPYACLAQLCAPDELDALADDGLVTMDRGRADVRLSEAVIAGTLKAQVMPAQSLSLFRAYAEVVDLDALSGSSLFGYLHWGLSLGFAQPEERVFAAVAAANVAGRYSDAAELIAASGWRTKRILLEQVRAEKHRGAIAEAHRILGVLLDAVSPAEADRAAITVRTPHGDAVPAEASPGAQATDPDPDPDTDPDPDSDTDTEADPDAVDDRYLSRLMCMDIRLTDPAAPERLRTGWVRERLTSAEDIGRVDATRARFELRGGRLDEALRLAEAVYHDHTCATRHRLRACAIIGVTHVFTGQVDLGIRHIDQAELMFGLPGLTAYEWEDAAPQIFVARYSTGDWEGARRSVARTMSGDRMFDFAGALVDVRTGHPAHARTTLDEVLAHAQETDVVDITCVGTAAKRYVDALLGSRPDPQNLHSDQVSVRPDRRSWWSQFEARLFDLQTLALSRPGPAADGLYDLGACAAERGARTLAANALMDAARLGHSTAAHELAVLGEQVEGAVGRLARTTAAGLLADEPAALLEASREALEFGAVVAGSDLAKRAQRRAVEVNDRVAAKEARLLLTESTRTVRFASVGSRLHAMLTEFERNLVDGVMAGRSSHELGELHHLSARTIEWHLTRIYRRLQVVNRRELRDLLSSWGER